jgi:hypothetical protein
VLLGHDVFSNRDISVLILLLDGVERGSLIVVIGAVLHGLVALDLAPVSPVSFHRVRLIAIT